MEKYSGIAMDTAGNTLAEATVTVYTAGTTTLAPIFSDNAFTPQSNPSTADADGTYFFYGHGRFDILITKDGFAFRPAQTSDLFLYDPMATLSFTAAAQQDDWAPLNGSAVSTWRLTADAPFTITGIAAGFAGQILTLINVSAANAITLAHDSASSIAANRLLTSGADYVLEAGSAAILQYDTISTRWRLTGVTAVSTTTVLTGTGVGLPGSTNLVGNPNAAAPTTQYDVSADLVVVRETATNTLTTLTAFAVTVDTSVAGPAANGRDQAGSFSSNSWVYLYAIGKADGTKAGLWSATFPPTGPTLPATYTHWAYLGAFRLDSSNQLVFTHTRGVWAFTASVQFGIAITATTEQAFNVSAVVPPNALSYYATFSQAAAAAQDGKLRVVSGGATIFDRVNMGNAGAAYIVRLPNVSQTFYYKQETTNAATIGFGGAYENAH